MRMVLRSKFHLLTLLCASAVLPILAGCGGGGSASSRAVALPTAVQADVTQGATVGSAVVTSNNTLGLALFAQLRASDAGKNVFISPTSIALALDMAYNGAAGGTQQAMAQALQAGGISLQDLNDGAAALQASLINPDPQVDLSVANSLWLRGGVVEPSFITANQTYYNAQVGDVAGAPANVNSWVSQQTHGKITNILPSGVDYSQIIAILVNALYFKGSWSNAFDPTATRSALFTLADGSQKTCPLMTEGGVFSYLQGANFQLVSLPFGQGRMSMVVLLPAAGTSLDTLLGGLDLATWNGWLTQMQLADGTVSMPRFTSNYGVGLKDALTALGMGVAFDQNSADFSNLAAIKPLFISFIEHKTTVAVDEKGTEATAATSIGVSTTATPTQQFTMRIDRPFFYAIRDNKTGEMLFLGMMQDPTATGS